MTFLAQFVNILAWILFVAILIRSIISWVNLDQSNPLVLVIYQITEPILAPIRRLLPNFGGLDLSPVVAIIIIFVVQRIVLAFAR